MTALISASTSLSIDKICRDVLADFEVARRSDFRIEKTAEACE
jgi:hypothetical protein